ncbi:MAG: hypothetical protein DMD90_04065 [Candidatus Rokuibacteriota bacterium]|nr:MAG: hypothetical protein DMD90_04065 [Candidatus Rokubacteria bacterium]
MFRAWYFFALCVVTFALSACTSMGFHNVDVRRRINFGPPDALSLCLLVDEGMTDSMARAIIDDAWREEGAIYGLRINVVSVRPWRRPAFTSDGIMDALLRQPLPAGCDRLFALVGRHAGDVLWGFFGLPEVLGAVDDDTSTHGYAVVGRVSLNQMFMSPTSVVRHEIYHLLGCDEHFNMSGCYDRIAILKRGHRLVGAEFFPARDAVNNLPLVSRDAVNTRLQEINGIGEASQPHN